MIGSITYLNHYFGTAQLIRTRDDLTPDLKLLVLWGGEDVDPSLYNQRNIQCMDTDKARDLNEMTIITKAATMGIPILGICKGSQLLCVHQGGTLWQHVENHANGSRESHTLDTAYHGKGIKTNSAHHQMVRPPKSPLAAEVLAWASEVRSPTKVGERGWEANHDQEVEVTYYPRINALGVQGHPEWLPLASDISRYTFQLLKEKCNVEI